MKFRFSFAPDVLAFGLFCDLFARRVSVHVGPLHFALERTTPYPWER